VAVSDALASRARKARYGVLTLTMQFSRRVRALAK